MESVEVFERGSSEQFERLCPGGVVYNLEVEGTHTYFAEGLAVHNCHHLAAGQWAAIMARYPKALHIGLSATPQRLDGRGLRAYFDVIVNGPSTGELIAAGYLSRFKYFAPGVPDLAGISTSMGDFNRGDLSKLMDKPKIIGDAVATYQRLAAGERAIMFCVDRAHSRNVAAAFSEAGIRTAHVDGAMPAAERDRLVAAWKAG
ncbi:MAG: hypothetical protein ACRCUI_11980, partial [Polymorphobacter sp.]